MPIEPSIAPITNNSAIMSRRTKLYSEPNKLSSLEQESAGSNSNRVSSKLVNAGKQALSGTTNRPGQKVIVIKDLLRTAGAFLVMPSANSSQKK